MTTSTRRGSLLIIVAGIAMIILSLTMAYLGVVRSDVGEVGSVLRDAQARAMLNAGLCYIAESSRIGWSTVGRGSGLPDRLNAETCGWNDVRNGAIGPIPFSVLTGSGIEDRPQDHGDTYRVGAGTGRWPDLGSTVRQSLYGWERPPYAVDLGGNPIVLHESADDVPASGGYYLPQYFGNNRDVWSRNLPPGSGETKVAGIGDGVHQYRNGGSGGAWFGALWRFSAQPRPDPSPVATTLADYNAGDPRARTPRAAWFRVYRETPQDHDGDGTPFYDAVALNGDGRTPDNGSVFVITCGAGATQGFRDWAEVVAELGSANAALVFTSEAGFWDRRREETILWFRAEWTPYTQVNLAPYGVQSYNGSMPGEGANHRYPRSVRVPEEWQSAAKAHPTEGVWHYSTVVPQRRTANPMPFGSFRWVAALDREPPRW